MTNADIILNFARTHDNNIARKEFMTWYSQEFPNGSLGRIDITLQNLVRNGILTRSGYWVFQISSSVKPDFTYEPSDKETGLFAQIKEQYPYTRLCIWNARALSPATEPIYEDVRKFAEDRIVLLKPKEREYHLYTAGRPAIIVKDFISESPIRIIDDITTPCLEKFW